MNIQEIALSNNQRKKIQKAVKDDSVLLVEENGDIVINVAAYKTFKQELENDPVEEIVGEDVLDFSAEYFVFN
ncbi:MAG: hypothetical protein HRU20_28305 [Pseudomonadales bacterium]|nr:hypothetical protein [Pseudomonadales bacterium]